MYTHYITHHVSFQQIISINSSLYKQIPQLRSQKEKAGIAAGSRSNSSFLYPWSMQKFRLFQRGTFQGQSAIRFAEDFVEPKGSVGSDAEGGAGFV